MRAAVVLILFNRPDLTRQVLVRIAQARPPHLWLFADGPRPEVPLDPERCAAARAAVADLPWPCRVRRDYASLNIGYQARITSALDAVFAEEEEAIVLEDDCIPAPSFLAWCAQLLERYRDEPRVGLIAGSNPVADRHGACADWSFARHTRLWGWAGWRRTWAAADRDFAGLDTALRDGSFARALPDPVSMLYWRELFSLARSLDEAWDYQLHCGHLERGLLTAYPRVNLVRNLGVGRADATHTTAPGPIGSEPCGELLPPFAPPAGITPDPTLDRLLERHAYAVPQDRKALLAWISRRRQSRALGGRLSATRDGRASERATDSMAWRSGPEGARMTAMRRSSR
jgi:hypothetical protein